MEERNGWQGCIGLAENDHGGWKGVYDFCVTLKRYGPPHVSVLSPAHFDEHWLAATTAPVAPFENALPQ